MWSFIGGIVGGLIGKLFVWFGTLFAAERAGEQKQREADLDATQSAEKQAADARNHANTDPAYADDVRRRYTDDSDE